MPADDKQPAHLNCITHLLEQIPYKPLSTVTVTLPEPDETNAYADRKSLRGRRYVPEQF